MRGAITLTTGLKDVLNLQPEDVKVWDWAWGLQHQCRYSGSTPIMWSVLSHTGLVYRLAMQEQKGKLSLETQIGLLLHDAPEAYLMDLPRPLKQLPEFEFFRTAEQKVLVAILTRFGLREEQIDWELVNRYDRQALWVEYQKLFPQFTSLKEAPPQIYPLDTSKIMLTVGKPKDYSDHLRTLAINIGTPTVNDLFEIPEHLNPYLKEVPFEAPIQTVDILDRGL